MGVKASLQLDTLIRLPNIPNQIVQISSCDAVAFLGLPYFFFDGRHRIPAPAYVHGFVFYSLSLKHRNERHNCRTNRKGGDRAKEDRVKLCIRPNYIPL